MAGAVHVVQRIRRGLPSLRTPRTYRVLERAFRAGKERDGFRLVHYSVQADHLHLVIDADDKKTLARGMQGLAIRIAKALNRKWNRRGRGSVFADRYFAKVLKSYRQVLRAVRYVLLNGRKHGVWNVKDRPDPYSSGPWHRGWTREENIRRPLRSPPVVPSRRDINLQHCWIIDVNARPGTSRLPVTESLTTLLAL